MIYKVLFVGVDCDVSRMMYHAVKDHWQVEKIIFEQPVSMQKKLKYRFRKLGLWSVAGQFSFKVWSDLFIVPFSKKRKYEILSSYNLSVNPISEELILQVEDVHDQDWGLWVAKYKPDFILINGTRILKKSLLDQWDMPVINIHAGITPMYRGVHGGYWSLVNDDKANFGATIHLVDAGVDTGQILKHVHAEPNKEDNFYTYPYLQFAEAIKELVSIVDDYMKGKESGEKGTFNPAFSKLWYYPTVFNYIYFRFMKGVK